MIADGELHEQIVFCKTESMTLVFNNVNGYPTKELKKEELGPMVGVTYMFVQQKQIFSVHYYPTLITIITVKN